jgi:hypothetical protein
VRQNWLLHFEGGRRQVVEVDRLTVALKNVQVIALNWCHVTHQNGLNWDILHMHSVSNFYSYCSLKSVWPVYTIQLTFNQSLRPSLRVDSLTISDEIHWMYTNIFVQSRAKQYLKNDAMSAQVSFSVKVKEWNALIALNQLKNLLM